MVSPKKWQLLRTYKEYAGHGYRSLSLPQNTRLREHAKFLDECDVKVIKERRH